MFFKLNIIFEINEAAKQQEQLNLLFMKGFLSQKQNF